ncbi:MAG: tRNA pseudouridine(55) synthase TruB [Alphaproteobacteria bacterium]
MSRRGRKGRPVNGWVCVDKPVGVTSTQAVGKVRYAFDAQKAGHAGTLDPLASGILAIALGEATKTIPYAVDTQKTYHFTVRWGEQTNTDDAEGHAIATSAARPDAAEIRAVLPEFTGEIMQLPPRFSAIKLAGARAYDLARNGEAFELSPRPVSVVDFSLIEIADKDNAIFRLVCGKGTYVRSLARDLGLRLGGVAHARDIRRLAVGPFTEANAISLEKLEQLVHNPSLSEHLLPVETPLDDIPAMAITGSDATRLKRGQTILARNGQFNPSDALICAKIHGKAVALGFIEAGEFRPVRIFNIPTGVMKSDVDYT